MSKTGLLLIPSLILLCFQGISQENIDTWTDAKWIGLEQLKNELVLVPGVHGSGDKLGNKARIRSVVPMFRKDFTLSHRIKSAKINICGLGHYELYLNGNKVGDRFLSPGWTNYQKRRLYNSFDITQNLKNGSNALGVLVGNGFYNINRERYRKLVIAYGYPMVIFNIRIEYENGSVKYVVSDEDCRVAPSPITFSSIFGGEDYDARLEQKGWSNFGFEDSSWQVPVLIDNAAEELVPEEDFPLKLMQEFNTQRTFKSKTGKTI